MESISHHKLLAVGDYLFTRRSCLQLVITFSLFSILISISWVTSGSIAKSYVYIKFNPFFTSFFTHTLERKYMFLIFNGILAFLASSAGSASTTSGIIRSSISPQSSASYAHHHHDEGLVKVDSAVAAADVCDEIDDDSDVEEEEGVQERDDEQDRRDQAASKVQEEKVKVQEEKVKVKVTDVDWTIQFQQQGAEEEEERKELEEKMKVQDGNWSSQFQQQEGEEEEVEEEEEEEEEEEGTEMEEAGNGCSTEEMNTRFDELLRLMKVRMMSESKLLKRAITT